ncbi:hypothetical protein GTP58_11920 [Duganella sp. CY15W]|uniref:hypothetical protein n=1 Tax=Duganella sp. CY15W TaxID=2692172 RepID=UPI00136F28A8|nr:hypothetical protein [Duganella sp. CY15W]MYM29027.1 hypothetical protein [Duganella sp. CY15W]
MKLFDVVQSLLPEGTKIKLLLKKAGTSEEFFQIESEKPDGYIQCPAWPPDLFAVVGTIIEKSSCYTFAGPDLNNPANHQKYLEEIFSAAQDWKSFSAVPPLIQDLWDAMLGAGSTEINEICNKPELTLTLLKLFAIADEACNGIGWSVDPTSSGINELVTTSFLDQSTAANSSSGKNDVPYLPYRPVSLCSLVRTDLAIVLPKSMTANVGCTIRSLSHHLALLPGSTQVEPSWTVADKPDNSNGFLRILAVPFPFHIPENSFSLKHDKKKINKNAFTPGFFGLSQNWLKTGKDDEEISGISFVKDLLIPLLQDAKKESAGAQIHGIVMPECALSEKLADEVAEALKDQGIEFFITGVLTKQVEGDRNIARTYLFSESNGQYAYMVKAQSKHHRWRIDEAQARRYALNFPDNSVLAEEHRSKQWWESIDVSKRTLPFFAIRKDISISVLICEDLARADPAMSVIRAVGPNLVFALLMDGPQLAARWPGRYATVLADDPGSSVLTLSCIGMVDRSNWLESRPIRSIGLWKDAGGRPQELNLPHSCQGMLLTLKSKNITQNTLDNRSDLNRTKKLALVSTVPLKVAHLPNWL